jgi:hypothetical protein
MPFGFLPHKDLSIIWLSNLLILSVPHEDNFRARFYILLLLIKQQTHIAVEIIHVGQFYGV